MNTSQPHALKEFPTWSDVDEHILKHYGAEPLVAPERLDTEPPFCEVCKYMVYSREDNTSLLPTVYLVWYYQSTKMISVFKEI